MIGILGAGVSGLSLSVLLDQGGISHRVLEREVEVGGVIRSERVEGRVVDWGPQRTRVTPPVRRMLDRLGLDDRTVVVPPDHPLHVFRGGRLRRVPFRPSELLRTDLLSARAKLRFLMEPLTGGPRPEETIGGFLTRKFGREVYENLMGPLYGGLYGSDPEEMYVRHALAGTLRGLGIRRSILRAFIRGAFNRSAAPPAVSFVDGMREFTDAMHRRVRERVEVGCGATRITRGEAGGWKVTDTEGGSHHFEAVVLTVPADAAADLLDPSVPDVAGRLRQLRYNGLVMVMLASDGPLHGLGYQVAYGEALRTRGVTWNASALGRRDVHTAFLGGAHDRELLELDDAEIGRIAAREFREVTGCDARVLAVGRTRIPSWDRSWIALDGLELPQGLHLCTNYESRVGIPGRIQRAEALAERLA
jgi:protoporphyrinogen/coproporphyrinogen III oxidase